MIKIENNRFKPNDLMPEDVDKLEDWQLLTATCHWGKTMGDCRTCEEGGYGYEQKQNWVDGKKSIYMGDVCLDNDIDMDDPEQALINYCGYRPSWKIWAREELKKRLIEEKELQAQNSL